jgi:hypothetical protein
MLNFSLCIPCDKDVSSLELWCLWSPFYVCKRNIWFWRVNNIRLFACFSIKYSNLTIFTCTSNVFVFQIIFTAINFCVWFTQTKPMIDLYLGFWIMFDGLSVTNWLFLLHFSLLFLGLFLLLLSFFLLHFFLSFYII